MSTRIYQNAEFTVEFDADGNVEISYNDEYTVDLGNLTRCCQFLYDIGILVITKRPMENSPDRRLA